MTDIIYDRAAVRENTIWGAFQFNGAFGTLHAEERTILFGLYANTYLHGQSYLNAIEAEDLAKLVDTYTFNMAQLTNDEAKLVLDISAKRYVENIEQQIHEANMVTEERKLDALDDGYDAKEAALSVDREAIITMQGRIIIERDKMEQKVRELEIQTQIEEVNQEMVDLDITREQLRSAQADLDILNAQLEGLNVQLAITEAGFELTNTNLAITDAANDKDEIGVRISEVGIQSSNTDVDIANTELSVSRAAIDGEKIQATIKEVGAQQIGVITAQSKARADRKSVE